MDRAAQTLVAGGCDPVFAVLGAEAGEVRRRAGLDGVRVVTNGEWETGMGSTLRAGLAAVEGERSVTAVVVLLVDMPGVTAGAVARVVGTAEGDPGGVAGALVAASYRGRRGHPVLFGRSHWGGVARAAVGDVGARGYLAGRPVTEVPCDDIADGRDVDTPGDLPAG